MIQTRSSMLHNSALLAAAAKAGETSQTTVKTIEPYKSVTIFAPTAPPPTTQVIKLQFDETKLPSK